ncbi:MAG: metallophosphoesterase [Oscillospiraceae bacterium]|jgi:Icc-related predicted phosphoesterase|nr:metallophosphoesterase [Oscillospiraceae bacterium]
MKLLTVSDMESAYIWDHFDPEAFRGIDLIISCGDLKASYLSFLVTMIPAPLLYVRGNHDERYKNKPPEGCMSIEEKFVTVKGLRIGGLSGCKSHGSNGLVFSEEKMADKVRKLEKEVRKAGGIDILATHAPSFDLGDGPDEFHKGFECYRDFIERWQPKFHLYGHRHLRGSPVDKRALLTHGETQLINTTGYRIVEF